MALKTFLPVNKYLNLKWSQQLRGTKWKGNYPQSPPADDRKHVTCNLVVHGLSSDYYSYSSNASSTFWTVLIFSHNTRKIKAAHLTLASYKVSNFPEARNLHIPRRKVFDCMSVTVRMAKILWILLFPNTLPRSILQIRVFLGKIDSEFSPK